MPNLFLSRPEVTASGTNLRGAEFTDANLTGANFDLSILDGANFTGADLTDARFYHGRIRHVTLKSVNVAGTRL